MPLKQQAIIGIDIGSDQIKLVQMNRKGEVLKWGKGKIPSGTINQGKIIAKEPLIKTMKGLIKERKIREKKCALCLSSSDVIIRELRLPPMAKDQIQDNVYYEISEYLPVDIQRYNIEYKVLDVLTNNNIKTLRIMVVAAPKEILKSYEEVMTLSGLKLKYIDISPNVLSKLVKRTKTYDILGNNEKGLCFIDFGAETTKITIFHAGIYYIHKSIPLGSQHITNIIASHSKTDFAAAESIKIQNDFMANDVNLILNKVIFSFLQELTSEILRVIQYYSNNNQSSGIGHIYLLGGGSLLKKLPYYLEEHLTIPVSFIDELLGQSLGKSFPESIFLVTFANAIGTTLREEGV